MRAMKKWKLSSFALFAVHSTWVNVSNLALFFKKMTKFPPPSVHFGLGGIFEVVSEAELVYISALVEDFRSTVQKVFSTLGNFCLLPCTQITILGAIFEWKCSLLYAPLDGCVLELVFIP